MYYSLIGSRSWHKSNEYKCDTDSPKHRLVFVLELFYSDSTGAGEPLSRAKEKMGTDTVPSRTQKRLKIAQMTEIVASEMS
jgi:hypothetical protein